MTALLLVRVSVLLAVALVGARLLRRKSASLRHAIWTMAFAAILVLPALPYVLPAIEVPVPVSWRVSPQRTPPASAIDSERGTTRAGTHVERLPAVTTAAAPADQPIHRASPAPFRGFTLTPALMLTTAWLAGTAASIAMLVLSLVRVRALERSAADLTDAGWRTAADAIAHRVGCAPPRLRVSSRVTTPMAGGLARPTIYLPPSASDWPPERREIVLAHELAHLARRDPLRHVAARAAVACYWFHPLAWIAAGDASFAREQACDETVLALGTRPSSYAQVLLDFAESGVAPRSVAALPIVERSLLEKRLMAILTHDARLPGRRRSGLAAAAIAVLAIAIAAVRPAARATAAGGPIDGAGPIESIAAIAPDVPATRPSAAERPQRASIPESDCNLALGGSFNGMSVVSDRSGTRVIYDLIGTRGADRIVMKVFGDLQVCMVAEGGGDDRSLTPSDLSGRARHTLIESRSGTAMQRLELTREGNAQRVRWSVNGVERPFDAAAQDWRERMLTVLDTTWEISTIRGQVSSLRGEISSIRGEESSLRGQISSLRGDVSSLRGRISSVRGDESSLRGEISSILGHVSSLRGQISSERGSISSLMASRYDSSDADRARLASRIREHEAEIDRLEKAIRDYGADAKIAAVERQIRDLDVEKQVEAIESQIRGLNTEGKIAEIEKLIRDLDVDGKTGAIERRIDSLNADRRARELEDRRDRELKELQAAIARIR